MSTYFISDLHLDEQHPELTACFIKFLQQQAYTSQGLYILGDLFEVWLGDDNLTPLNQTVFTALKQLSDAGVPVYFMRGNRDFLIGSRFSKATGVTILTDPCVIDLYGKAILLMHGDLLCIDDKSYQAFRRRAHNPLLKKLFLMLPLSWRKRIASKAREKSQQHTQKTDLAIQDVNQVEVERLMEHYQVSDLIHGHTHRPNIHHFNLNNKPVSRYVLNAWHEQGGGLVVTPNHKINLFSLSLSTQ